MYKLVARICRSILILLGVCSLIYMVPVYKHSYFRDSLGKSVVKIAAGNKQGQYWTGTGFHLRLPSGRIAILTNRHVCDDAMGSTVFVIINGISHPRKILEMSKSNDLCLVEPVLDSGVRLASNYSDGEPIVTLGHPSGYQLTMTEGEIVGYEIMRFVEPYQGKGTCIWDNQSIQEFDVPSVTVSYPIYYQSPSNAISKKSIKVKACVTVEKSVITTSQIKPGSSGSPVFNVFGNVVGIQHATDLRDNWGRMVSLESIKKFTRNW